MTLWAAVVAERLGHDQEAALTLGKAVARLNAQAKGRRLGIYEEPPDKTDETASKPAPHTWSIVRDRARSTPCQPSRRAEVRATIKGQPIDPASVRRYLARAFGRELAAVQAALEALAQAYPPAQLAARAYPLSEQFRPAVPEGTKGWGAKGDLSLDAIRALVKKGMGKNGPSPGRLNVAVSTSAHAEPMRQQPRDAHVTAVRWPEQDAMKNSQTFLDSFAAIEKWLRSLVSANRATGLYQLVEIASRSNRTVARYRDDLKEYADLRNAIVHERSDGHMIAELNDAAVADFGRLRSVLLNPPNVIPTFQVTVQTREASQALSEAVTVMLEGSFSQLAVMEEGRVIGLLTSNTIARWLGHEVATDLFSLRETTIAEVLRFTEAPENHCFLGRRSTLFEALARVEDFAARGKDLDAILLTHHGRSDESLLGILTLYDLPKILKMLGLTRFSAT